MSQTLDYQQSYYQKNKEWIRKRQTQYFKEYYEKNKLELNERNRIRNNARYNRKKKSTKEEMLPTIEEFEILEKSLKKSQNHSPKSKSRKPKAPKKTPKPREAPPRYSFAKGEFILSFD